LRRRRRGRRAAAISCHRRGRARPFFADARPKPIDPGRAACRQGEGGEGGEGGGGVVAMGEDDPSGNRLSALSIPPHHHTTTTTTDLSSPSPIGVSEDRNARRRANGRGRWLRRSLAGGGRGGRAAYRAWRARARGSTQSSEGECVEGGGEKKKHHCVPRTLFLPVWPKRPRGRPLVAPPRGARRRIRGRCRGGAAGGQKASASSPKRRLESEVLSVSPRGHARKRGSAV
jgi:hypothetical protein